MTSSEPCYSASKGIYIYQQEATAWRWQVIVGQSSREGTEDSYAHARLRADNALASLEARL